MSIRFCLAAAFAAALATLQPAEARDRSGAALAVGILGGLAAGTAIGAATAQPRPVYVAPARPRVVMEEVEEEPICTIRRRRFIDEYGDVTIRRERVCD